VWLSIRVPAFDFVLWFPYFVEKIEQTDCPKRIQLTFEDDCMGATPPSTAPGLLGRIKLTFEDDCMRGGA